VNLTAVDAVVRAVLYEGHILYPYRPSSVKNRHRFMFGTLAPPGSVEPSSMRTECLLVAEGTASLDVRVRFLQAAKGLDGGDPSLGDAVEREMQLGERSVTDLCRETHERAFEFCADASTAAIFGVLRASASAVCGRAFRIQVDVENTTPRRPGEDASLRSLASTHTLLGATGGEFCSLSDPPDDLRAHAEACRNLGTWPTLLTRDTVLSSPIILPDFPVIAPESAGDLFDATEIDEILTLRILTLTEGEKREINRHGGRARALLERTEALTDAELSRLHGALRTRSGARLQPGDRVKLAPRGRADVFDLALAGRAATVVSVEEDFEGDAYVTVTVDDDPGRDLGCTGQPGHRFFFRTNEVEPLA
jgi:hypothetical protein